MNLIQNLSKNLKNFEPYTAGASMPDISKKIGIPVDKIVKLDANENFFIEEDWIRTRIKEAVSETPMVIYPDKLGINAREALSNYLGVEMEQLLLGCGSDDLLLNLSCAFFDQESNIITTQPSFSMYEFFANLFGANMRSVDLKSDFQIDIDTILSQIDEKTKLIFIATPNNPTGNQFPKEEILNLIENSNTLIIVDEAYVDFANYNMIKYINDYDNLAILRTFSKSWGLAGLRIGLCATNSELINILRGVQIPFTLNSVSQSLIPIMVKNENYIKNKAKEVIKEREWLYNQLRAINQLIVYKSQANFILVRSNTEKMTMKELINALMYKGVLIRDQTYVKNLDNCARITVGTRDMNFKLLESLKEILKLS
ncbi:MAG: histidinol-phosphate transaminase [Candidatus Lokiarchaeota archaeon]|nr:histidinol-phosphate transaminase [Candidatus Lokiarchaeota archaeon]